MLYKILQSFEANTKWIAQSPLTFSLLYKLYNYLRKEK